GSGGSPNASAGSGATSAGMPGFAGSGTTSGGAGSGVAGASTGTGGRQNGTAGSAVSSGGRAGFGGNAQGGDGSGATGYACEGTKPSSAIVSSFDDLTPSADVANQFLFMNSGMPGGTYTFGTPAPTIDIEGQRLNVQANVSGYAGFGLYLNSCMDLSQYRAISFRLGGNVGASSTLSFRILVNDDIPIDDKNKSGNCQAPSGVTDPYEYCRYPSFEIAVTASASVHTVSFTDLAAGNPVPVVLPNQIKGFEWAFDSVDTPYDVSVSLDDVVLASGQTP
ncbi:MAG TPA: hypothetical protein VEQ59_22135, partial [Polyangiaceae bacterium]|nr:hypothetical protein [Polyangiaceae bacterium]